MKYQKCILGMSLLLNPVFQTPYTHSAEYNIPQAVEEELTKLREGAVLAQCAGRIDDTCTPEEYDVLKRWELRRKGVRPVDKASFEDIIYDNIFSPCRFAYEFVRHASDTSINEPLCKGLISLRQKINDLAYPGPQENLYKKIHNFVKQVSIEDWKVHIDRLRNTWHSKKNQAKKDDLAFSLIQQIDQDYLDINARGVPSTWNEDLMLHNSEKTFTPTAVWHKDVLSALAPDQRTDLNDICQFIQKELDEEGDVILGTKTTNYFRVLPKTEEEIAKEDPVREPYGYSTTLPALMAIHHNTALFRLLSFQPKGFWKGATTADHPWYAGLYNIVDYYHITEPTPESCELVKCLILAQWRDLKNRTNGKPSYTEFFDVLEQFKIFDRVCKFIDMPLINREGKAISDGTESYSDKIKKLEKISRDLSFFAKHPRSEDLFTPQDFFPARILEICSPEEKSELRDFCHAWSDAMRETPDSFSTQRDDKTIPFLLTELGHVNQLARLYQFCPKAYALEGSWRHVKNFIGSDSTGHYVYKSLEEWIKENARG